jgi:hypothetical protein
MPNKLIEFWREYTPEVAPFAHPADLSALRKKPRWIAENDPIDFHAYLKSSRFGNPKDDRLHLSLFPVPYLGNLEKAEIVILLLNPGFEYSDYWADTVNPEYRKRLEQNLHQDFKGISFPFLCLDPQFCWHSGFMWWEKKLRKVLHEITAKKFGGDYYGALRDLSTKLGCIELIPYHSESFKDHSLIGLLPSVARARDFVTHTLVPEAAADKRTIIATRQVKQWGLLRGMRNVRVYEGGHTRGASLSPTSEGGKAILQHYGIA